jgi:hypothetical protein
MPPHVAGWSQAADFGRVESRPDLSALVYGSLMRPIFEPTARFRRFHPFRLVKRPFPPIRSEASRQGRRPSVAITRASSERWVTTAGGRSGSGPEVEGGGAGTRKSAATPLHPHPVARP